MSRRSGQAGSDAHPRLLGALLDLAAGVLARMPELQLARKPRMADFAKVLAAVDAELGTDALTRYAESAAGLAAESLSSSSLAARMLDAITARFTGTSAQLLALVTPAEDDWRPPRDWPKNARAVTTAMRRLAPAFRKTGWTVEQLSPGHDNALRWNISPSAQPEKAGSDPRGDSQRSLDDAAASNASESEGSAGTSTSADQKRKACPRHASTGFGPRRGCLDCEATQ